MIQEKISIVLPARNEAPSLDSLLPKLRDAYPEAEIIVVNDGSSDDTAAVAQRHGALVVSHPYSIGNGAAIKSGARHASGDVIVFSPFFLERRPSLDQFVAEGTRTTSSWRAFRLPCRRRGICRRAA